MRRNYHFLDEVSNRKLHFFSYITAHLAKRQIYDVSRLVVQKIKACLKTKKASVGDTLA